MGDAGMSTIYLVSSGDYSDYSVHAAFSTKDKAEKFIDAFAKPNYSQFEIEERRLDPCEAEIKKGLSPYRVFMRKSGNSECSKMDDMYSIPIATEVELLTKTYHGKSSLRIEGWFKSKEHAVKVANEKRTAMIANGEWTQE